MIEATEQAIHELVQAGQAVEQSARAAEDALLAAFRRGEAKAFDRIAALLSEAPRFDQANLQKRLAWYFENIPSLEAGAAQLEFYGGVKSYVDNYNHIAELGTRVLQAGRVPLEFSEIPKDLIDAIKARDVGYFSVLNRAALERLDQVLLDQVITGANPRGALESIRGTIKGTYKWGKGRGMYEWHAGTYARTGQLRFQRQVMKAKADQLELRHFVYVGPVDSKKRPFCLGIVGGAFSDKEIEEMDNGQTGDVMSDGGGYNCRDTWSPVDKSLFDELKGKDGKEAVKEEMDKAAPKTDAPAKTSGAGGAPPQNATGWTPADTLKGATKWARDNELAKVIDFGKLDLEVANIMNNRMAAHLEAFPQLRGKLDFYGSMQKFKKWIEEKAYEAHKAKGYSDALARRLAKKLSRKLRAQGELAYQWNGSSALIDGNGGKCITANEAWLAPGRTRIKTSKYPFDGGKLTKMPNGEYKYVGEVKEGLDKFHPAMLKSEASGFHPAGCGNIQATMDHEIGHFIDNVLAGGVRGYKTKSWDSFDDIVQKIYSENATKDIVLSKYDAVKEALSGYAAHSRAEFLAEAWSEFLVSPAPREVARAVGELILEVMKAAQ